MFGFRLLKDGSGFVLDGDYRALVALHEVIHQANESCVIKDKEGWLLALAYDVRKTIEAEDVTPIGDEFERRWETIKKAAGLSPARPIPFNPAPPPNLIWPALLVQTRMLREALAFMDSTKLQQAMTYALEAVVEDAIEAAFGPKAAGVKAAYQRINPRDPAPEQKLGSRLQAFMGWSKIRRRDMLENLLETFDQMYPAKYHFHAQSGKTGLIDPAYFDRFAEYDQAE